MRCALAFVFVFACGLSPQGGLELQIQPHIIMRAQGINKGRAESGRLVAPRRTLL